MTKQDIINYVTETPQNTNPAVLNTMLNQLSSGGGGGGSSDFSTATVTLIDNDVVGAKLYGAFCDSENIHSKGRCYTDDESEQIILYKGKAVIDAYNILEENAKFTVSGDALISPAGDYITVTGDCTITIS